MVLTSQTPRPMNRHRFMSRRRRARRGPTLLIAAAIVVIVGAAWFIYGGWPTRLGNGGNGSANPGAGPAPVVADQLARGDAISGGSVTPPAAGSAPAGAAPTVPSDRGRGETDDAGPGAITMGDETTSPARDAVNAIASLVSNVTQPVEPVQAADPAEVVRGSSLGNGATGKPSDDLARGLALTVPDPVQARRILTPIVADRSRPLAERDQARRALGEISAVLVFSPRILPGDAFSEVYVVQPGDSLVRIAQEQRLDTDWRFLKRINGIADERRLREGQRIKLVVGAFHAVISKSEYRMDVYLGEGRERVMVASFPVGLGEYNSTPTGVFKVRSRSKLVNPQWTNPRTGQSYAADDPKNPIGERWIGLQGAEPSNKDIEGYGIHGTIDPGSIGRQASMGCVRMNAGDVEVVYELLTEPGSTIEIVP